MEQRAPADNRPRFPVPYPAPSSSARPGCSCVSTAAPNPSQKPCQARSDDKSPTYVGRAGHGRVGRPNEEGFTCGVVPTPATRTLVANGRAQKAGCWTAREGYCCLLFPAFAVPDPSFTSSLLGELLKSRVKNVFTLCPKFTEPSRTFSHAFLASGLAASPASLIFSPATSAPPTTVLPTPFAVSTTP